MGKAIVPDDAVIQYNQTDSRFPCSMHKCRVRNRLGNLIIVDVNFLLLLPVTGRSSALVMRMCKGVVSFLNQDRFKGPCSLTSLIDKTSSFSKEGVSET